MALSCFIRYQIDPFQSAAFQRYAELRIGLAADERYRAALREDVEGRVNFERSQSQRFILREERSRLEEVPGTRNRIRQVAP